MTPRRTAAIARHELRILRRDPAPLVIILVVPLLLIGLLSPAYVKAGLLPPGGASSGAVQVVPGMAVTFAFAIVGSVGFAFFRDHAWRTWDRLRSSPATGPEMLAGKAAAPIVLAGGQIVVLFGFGPLLFGLEVRGSLIALALVGAAFSLCLMAMGMALAFFCRTLGQLDSITNVGALTLAGLGGAIVPFELLPDWVASVAPLDPAYWAMHGYQEVIVDGGGVLGVLPSIACLLGFSALFAMVAALRFRFDESKASWA